MSEFKKQVGGSHYLGMTVQPVQLTYAVFGGDALVYNLFKYLTRQKEAWVIQGDKAKHTFRQVHALRTSSPIPHHITYAQQEILRVFIDQQPLRAQAPMEVIADAIRNIHTSTLSEIVEQVDASINTIVWTHEHNLDTQ